jgi:hypothetical protein
MKKILLFLLVALLFQGCEKYLDKAPDSSGMSEEVVFTDYLNFRQFEDRMYKDLNDYLANYDYGFIAAVCDEGFTVSFQWETLRVIQDGNWTQAYRLGQAMQFKPVWDSWQSIRIANISLKNLHMLTNVTEEEKSELKGQAHFMRAWYYYEFLRRQGGMPYITEPLYGAANFALPRLTYDETAQKIVADCDSAAALLPVKWDNANIGRPTKGAALALKANTYLFNASPTNNPSNDQTKWEASAKAAWDLINFSETTQTYKLMTCNSTDKITYKTPAGVQTINFPGGYDSIFNFLPYNDEIIWENYKEMGNTDRYRTFTTRSLDAGEAIQGFSPSQNIVDLFETKNGLSIKDDPTYDEQNPYINRDPRFYHCILFNQERWSSNTDYYLGLYNGGTERLDQKQYSYTGYLARKFWVNNIDKNSKEVHPLSHCIYFRYAEVLMWYAEAANEIGGPNYTLPGASLSALDALNKIRQRVNMPPVDSKYLTDKNTFRERIKNERAIEFYLEGKRFFDLARWGDASKIEHKQVFGITITTDASKPTGYAFTTNTTPVNTLSFDQKHYRWPIRSEDATMFPEFKQNPGW